MKKQTSMLLLAVAIIVISSIVFLSAKDETKAPVATETPAPQQEEKSMTLGDVATHNSATDCYTIVSGNVYNLTDWINKHPGGAKAILGLCGKDGTTPFTKQHGSNANAKAALESFLIGKVQR